MKTSSLYLGIALDGSPAEVFEALTDSSQHSSFTGAESVINPVEDGRFSYFGGRIKGVFRELSEPQRIVQELRADDWPAGHTVTVELEISPQAEGRRTFVNIREDDIPADRLEEVRAGWTVYWEQLSTYLRDHRMDVVRRFVERYKNQQDWDAVDDFLAEDCKINIPLPGLPKGREGMRVNGRMMCTAFPDVQVTREFFITDGELVVERALAEAHHEGPLMGLPPTGRPVGWTELHAYRVRDGRICEVWSEADFMGVMAQLGAVDLPTGESV